MKNAKTLIPLIMIAVLLTACGGGQPEQGAVETQVAALLTQQVEQDAGGQQAAAATPGDGSQSADPDNPISIDAQLYPVPADASCTGSNSARVVGTVTDVWSGDSIQVNINGQSYEVRYIGVDAGDQPADTNRQLVEGKQVLLITDTTDADEFGRLPRYVIADGVFVNLELLRRNAVYISIEAPDLSCEQVFKQTKP
jgi:hypothetical protein